MADGNKIEVLLEGEALEEVCQGMMLAELAITDCKKDTLRKIMKTCPWHLEAMKYITGSEEQSHMPLSIILQQDMNGLLLDCELDIGGITKGGHFLDTQGYIAHNDEMVVVSFRCTTSAFDWLTNLNTTSSAWELEEDMAQGFSGLCSGFDDIYCTGGTYKPTVHTGFYNNFLAALPTIKHHVDPLLKTYERPRKLFVVGHSLGAGIATLAGCYFLTEYNWNEIPQQLVIVTAGSPRACCESMKDIIDEKRQLYSDKCRMYRIVKGNDVVTSVPPKIFGFRHLIDPIKITDEGKVLQCTKQDDSEADLSELTKYQEGCEDDRAPHRNMRDDHSVGDEHNIDPNLEYERLVSRIPKALRDHMPDFYLLPMLRSIGLNCGSSRPDLGISRCVSVADGEDTENKSQQTTFPKSPETVDENYEGVAKTSRKWIPKVFRSKRTAPVDK